MRKNETLKQKFCAQFNCIEEAYEQVALKQFLPRPWQWFSMPILVINSKLVATEIQLLDQLAVLADLRSIESFDFAAHNKKTSVFGFIRRLLGFQVSRARVLNFARTAYLPRNTSSPRSHTSEYAAAYLRRQTR